MVDSDHLRGAQIVIVGAGAVGAALSYRLAQAGASVTTVERRYPGAGTSGNSFGWLNGFSKTPKAYHRLNVLSIRDHQDLADELDGDWVHVHGGLHWAHASDTIRTENLRTIVRRLLGWGARIDTATPEMVMRDLEPDLWIDPEAVPEVYVAAREGWIDTATMVHAVMQAAVTRYGATLVRGNVCGLSRVGDAVSGVLLEDGSELSADIVINAAGPEAGRLGALAGAPLALDRHIGMLVSTAPAPVRLRHVVHAQESHARPDGGGRILFSRENLDSQAVEGEVPPLDAEVIRDAMADTCKFLPGLRNVEPQGIRIGVRPMPQDGVSIVGFDEAISGLYTVVTHSGITLSARLALLVTEELTGEDVPELEPYRPSRFASQHAAVHPEPVKEPLPA